METNHFRESPILRHAQMGGDCVFAAGGSPFGVMCLRENLWETTKSLWEGPQKRQTQQTQVKHDSEVVLGFTTSVCWSRSDLSSPVENQSGAVFRGSQSPQPREIYTDLAHLTMLNSFAVIARWYWRILCTW